MPIRADQREAIAAGLRTFETGPLADAARRLFGLLGYASDRRIAIETPDAFLTMLDPGERLTDSERDAHRGLRSLHLLFQLTDAELATQDDLFDDRSAIDKTKIESYLFFAAELPAGSYTRAALSTLVRAINKPLLMPAIILFRHGEHVSIGIIHRRLHRRDPSRDVLEKVTLIKDIRLADPVRAHVEILNDFVLDNLDEDFGVSNFVRLHEAWSKRLDAYALNERFYREVANWYFWAITHPKVVLPRSINALSDRTERDKQRSLFFIRLLTRLIFCWFLQEKELLPRDVFRRRIAYTWLRDATPEAGTYYQTFLQNLFFATLNQEQDRRDWRRKYEGSRDGNRGITNLWRYQNLVTSPEKLEALFRNHIPFVNGGLFDCLDDVRDDKERSNLRLDDFSEERENRLCLPNELFFGEDREVDLSAVYDDTRRRKEKVRGIIEILNRYKFTVEENTPLEEEIALDPELLGKVFENLLASYSEETGATARKALGAFYTPREIVGFMVDEALIGYLTGRVPAVSEQTLRLLFSPETQALPLTTAQRSAMIQAIGQVKILDPACGSGAFPMGALHRLVDLLQKLDPNNETWKRDRLAEAERYYDMLRQANAPKEELDQCETRIEDIRRSFDTRFHALDFARKLYLIENCIYGVDIQPIACQIARLRFFIALIVDQGVDPTSPNLGVRPLPNLETRLVAADALLPIEKPAQQLPLLDQVITPIRRELEQVRHDHFNARTPARKAHLRERDAELRGKIAGLLKDNGMPAETAQTLASWDPYDQNHAAAFFDPEWMFGLPVGRVRLDAGSSTTLLGRFALVNETEGQMEFVIPHEIESGFDIVIGNPPYVRQQQQLKPFKEQSKKHYACFTGAADLYVYFYERAAQLLKTGGSLAIISSNKYFRAGYGEKLRKFLATRFTLRRLIDFGDAPVFKAIAYPSVLIGSKTPPKDGSVRALTWEPGPAVEAFPDVFAEKAFDLPQRELKADGWRIEGGATLRLLEKLRKSGTPLGEYVNGRFYRGITTGLNEAFVVDRDTRDRLIAEHPSSEELLKPFLRGRDVKRWRVEPQDLWLIRIPSSENTRPPWSGHPEREAERLFAATYPAIHRRFDAYRDKLIKRDDQGKYFWELRSCAYWQEFEREKIISTKISLFPTFAQDAGGGYLANTTYFLPIDVNGLYLLALLNSKVFHIYAKKVFVQKQNGWYEIQPDGLQAFPIPSASASEQEAIGGLVSRIL